mmetsp:Transcript_39293/g.82167  ORF Transcript_39293/g.82167 Transcript_39293/m.82167 type:complete len:217 (+) Transcript_39293:974-1624(+)
MIGSKSRRHPLARVVKMTMGRNLPYPPCDILLHPPPRLHHQHQQHSPPRQRHLPTTMPIAPSTDSHPSISTANTIVANSRNSVPLHPSPPMQKNRVHWSTTRPIPPSSCRRTINITNTIGTIVIIGGTIHDGVELPPTLTTTKIRRRSMRAIHPHRDIPPTNTRHKCLITSPLSDVRCSSDLDYLYRPPSYTVFNCCIHHYWYCGEVPLWSWREHW